MPPGLLTSGAGTGAAAGEATGEDAADRYELLDLGAERKLERFGRYVLDRPAPGAVGAQHLPSAAWRAAHARFERGRGASGSWRPGSALPSAWPVHVAGLELELRPTPFGHVGLFPEHAAQAEWLEASIGVAARRDAPPGEPANADQRPAVLHLFAYTGLVTLVAARAGAAVTHVDAARPTVAWARRNAVLSDLDTAPVRWIVDDALAFAEREARRGRCYAGVVLDPPTYGHGANGRPWELRHHLPRLLAACAAVTDPLPGLLLLTAHTPGVEAEDLAGLLHDAWPAVRPVPFELALRTADGRHLRAGAGARWPS